MKPVVFGLQTVFNVPQKMVVNACALFCNLNYYFKRKPTIISLLSLRPFCFRRGEV